jgi:hypothetical protein
VPTPDTGDRLDGWKDIASHLRKSVRTAIRWEKELGLPVRRLQGKAGEVVFAFRSEIDEWLRRHEPAERKSSGGESSVTVDTPSGESPSKRSSAWARRPLSVVTLLAAGALALVVVGWLLVKDRNPSGWQVGRNSLILTNRAGREVCRQTFDFDLDPAAYAKPEPRLDQKLVALTDLDGDGRREAVMRVSVGLSGDQAPEAVLYVFESDCSLRFSYTFDEEIRFGKQAPYGPPFPIVRLLVDSSTTPATIVVVSQHCQRSAAVVRRLSAHGAVLNQYWTNGHVRVVATVPFQGRRLLAVGATNDESRRPSLTLLDLAQESAVVPAADPEQACSSCQGGPPFAHFLFPVNELATRQAHVPYVTEVRRETADLLRISVEQYRGRLPGDGQVVDSVATVYYTLNKSLDLTDINLGDDYRDALKRAEGLGLMPPRGQARAEQAIRDVRKWNGTRFEAAGPADRARPVRRAAGGGS